MKDYGFVLSVERPAEAIGGTIEVEVVEPDSTAEPRSLGTFDGGFERLIVQTGDTVRRRFRSRRLVAGSPSAWTPWSPWLHPERLYLHVEPFPIEILDFAEPT